MHDLPDFVYFNHEIHVNKGVGCATCHGRVDQMPLMYAAELSPDGVVLGLPSRPGKEFAPHQRDLQHGLGKTIRNSQFGARRTNEKTGVPTAQTVNCVTKNQAKQR